MNYYVFLNYGAKPQASVLGHPAASGQVKLARVLAQRYPNSKVRYVSDYARSVPGLDSLPHFQRVLRSFQSAGRGLIFLDDLARIFRNAPLPSRKALIEELEVFGEYIFSLRHNKKLSEFTDREIELLLLHPEKSKSVSTGRGRRNTDEARKASAISRSVRSKEVKSEIRELQQKMQQERGVVTLQTIADEANSLGLRTSRGKEWTRQTIGRALE